MCMNCMNSTCGGCANKNECTALGPFEAIEAACITTPPATGSIIPFSSGNVPVVLTSVAGGAIGTVSEVGFGTSITGVTLVGTNIDVTSALLGTEAFSVPRAGNITSISASFSATVGVTVGTTTITAQVYRAPAGSNVFSPTSALVNLAPALTTIAVGTIAFGTANVVPIPVAAGDRLLMVFSITSTGAATVTGNASAGINIV